jgi:hypothetical protein
MSDQQETPELERYPVLMSTTVGSDRSWVDVLTNPAAVRSLYSREPSVEEIFALALGRDGPTIEMTCLLDRFPDTPPAKWVKAGSNRALVTIKLDGIKQVRLHEWSTCNRGQLVLETLSRNEVRFTFTSNGLAMLEGVAMFADVKGFDHYLEASS